MRSQWNEEINCWCNVGFSHHKIVCIKQFSEKNVFFLQIIQKLKAENKNWYIPSSTGMLLVNLNFLQLLRRIIDRQDWLQPSSVFSGGRCDKPAWWLVGDKPAWWLVGVIILRGDWSLKVSNTVTTFRVWSVVLSCRHGLRTSLTRRYVVAMTTAISRSRCVACCVMHTSACTPALYWLNIGENKLDILSFLPPAAMLTAAPYEAQSRMSLNSQPSRILLCNQQLCRWVCEQSQSLPVGDCMRLYVMALMA